MTTESSMSSHQPNAQAPALVVDHQVHWYPPCAVEELMGRSAYPKAEGDAGGNYVLLLDERISPLAGSGAKHPLEHYFKTNFYVDTAAGNRGALRLAIETYGIERVVFATDYPFYPMSSVRSWVEDGAGTQAARRVYDNRVPGLRLPAPASRA